MIDLESNISLVPKGPLEHEWETELFPLETRGLYLTPPPAPPVTSFWLIPQMCELLSEAVCA